MAILQVVGIASILPFMQLVSDPGIIESNQLLRKIHIAGGFTSHRSMLIAAGILVLVLLAIANAFSAFTTWLQHKFAWEVAHNLSTRLLRNYLNKPYIYFLQNNTSSMLNNTVVEVVQLTTGVLIPLTELAARVLVVLVIFSLLIFIDPQLAFTVLITLSSAYGIIYLVIRRNLRKLGKDRLSANQGLMKSLNEVLTGIKTFRVFGVQRFFYDRFSSASSKLIRIHPKVQLLSTTPRYAIEVLAFGGILTITLYLLITSKDLKAALPLLSLYALAGYRLLPALQNAFSSITKLKNNYPIVEKLYEDLQFKDAPLKEEMNTGMRPFSGQMEIKDLSFIYPENQQAVLENLNVTIKKGETVAFVGETGSGKTTLIDLVTGLLEATSGEILVDGIRLQPDNSASWQRQLGYVPQDIFLFDDTVARNIALGLNDEEIDRSRLEKVAKIAKIHQFIVEEMAEGYESSLGERGVRLSGGQRQRLGLARALYHGPNLLILDEATSALDGITENAVIEALNQEVSDLTILIIAHRLSTVRNADCIYLLKSGRMVASGNYETLIKTSDIFREMAQLS